MDGKIHIGIELLGDGKYHLYRMFPADERPSYHVGDFDTMEQAVSGMHEALCFVRSLCLSQGVSCRGEGVALVPPLSSAAIAERSQTADRQGVRYS